jgi:hypothetical protein
MEAYRQAYRQAFLIGLVILTLTGCSVFGAEEASDEAEPVDESVTAPDEVVVAEFRLPADCTGLLPDSALRELEASGIELLRGPGSPSADPIYIEGQTPEELEGGLSCFFSVPGEEESGLQILLSVAEVSSESRPRVINELVINQGLLAGATNDGALTYWKWGDEVGAAVHNALYADSWYSVIVQPGGRPAYDQGVALVASMRSHTTG